jgi:glycosyltransferase involved in cell wall biosynthesis
MTRFKLRSDLVEFIQYESIYGFIPAFFSKIFLNVKIIGDDIIFSKRESFARKILHAFILKNTDYIIVSNFSTYMKLKDLYQNKEIIFLPNGVFKNKIDFSKKNFNRIIFVGVFTYKENIDALRSIIRLPKMIRSHKKYELLLIGGPLNVLRKAKIQKINRKIKFLGYLEEKHYNTILESAFIGLLPFFNKDELEGQRIKTLEFLSHGILTLSTLQGVRGIKNLMPGEHYLKFSNLEELKSLLQKILESPEAYIDIARRGQQFITKKYHWTKVTESYIRLIKCLLKN